MMTTSAMMNFLKVPPDDDGSVAIALNGYWVEVMML
jgi:hypothetical protein